MVYFLKAMEFSQYSATGFGQHVKHALAQKVFASRYISTKNQNVKLRKDHMLYRWKYVQVHLHIFASGQIFPGPRKPIHPSDSVLSALFCERPPEHHCHKESLSCTRFPSKDGFEGGIIQKISCTYVRDWPNWDIILGIDWSQYGKQPCTCCHGQ